LGVTQQIIAKRPHKIEKIQKERKWVPYKLTEVNKNEREEAYLSLLKKQHRKSFLWKIVIKNIL